MSVTTYRPNFTITVYKILTRADDGQPSRLQGGQVWDLTPHLGDGSEISVSKSVKSPKGSFVITVPDQPYAVSPEYGATADTLYGLLEPMDEIEIRLARQPEQYSGGNLPLLMRGFIRTIRRAETMSANGKPQRVTVIQGNDYGFIFEMTQLPPLIFLNYGLGIAWQSPWEAFFQIGQNQKPRRVGEFFQLLLTHLINRQLATMNARFTDIPLDDPQPVKGQVVMTSQDQLLGSIWNVFIQWADTPWNELWIEDPETTGDDPPRLRFRTAPYRTWIKDGRLLTQGETIEIMGQQSSYDTVRLTIADVVQLDASRSEGDVANIYWVNSPVLEPKAIQTAEMSKAAAANRDANGLPGYMLLDGDEYPNSDPDLYCYRTMELNSRLLPDALTSGIDGESEQTIKAAGGIIAEWPNWVRDRRKALVEMNCDNVLLEDGAMVVKGNEQIRAGKYIVLQRGAFSAEYYAETVTHRFAPYRQYTTEIHFVRGTGFIERTRLTDSPYLREGKQGVYQPDPVVTIT